MPKIPLSNSANAIQHTRAAAYITGGNQRLHYYGDGGDAERIAKAADTLGRGLTRLSSTALDFLQEKTAAEDRLAAAEDRALFAERAQLLEQRFAEYPGAPDDEKQQWITDFQEQYQIDRRDIVSRMSEKYRKMHDLEMGTMQTRFANDRLRIINATTARRLSEQGEELYRAACERGDFDEASRIISENEGSLWSPDVAANMRDNDLPMRREFFEARNLVESSPELALQELQERRDGKYSKYTLLSSEAREKLLRAAKGRAADNLVSFTQGYIAKINAGDLTESFEDFKAKFDEGKISQEQFNAVSPYIKRYHADLAKRQSERELQDRRLEQLRTEDEVGAFVYKTLYAPDGSTLSYQASELAQKRVELIKLCKGNRALLDKYMPKINSTAAPETSQAPKTVDFWKTPDGEIINGWIKMLDREVDAFAYKPDVWNKMDLMQKRAHHVRMVGELRNLAKELYQKAENPRDVLDTLRWAKLQMNEGTVSSFLEWRTTNLNDFKKRIDNARAEKSKMQDSER